MMRIDRFLVCIRLVKSRTLAQALVATGRLRVDGRRIDRPSDTVRAGNVLTVPVGRRVRVLRVIELPIRRGPPGEARACYAELGVDAPAGQT